MPLVFLLRKEPRSERDFRNLIHEAFHVIDQNLWPVKKSVIGRFTQKREMDCTPRKYRALVRYYLKEALKNSSKDRQKALEKAAYWNKKHREEFPWEVSLIDSLDNVEGTAEFAEIRAKALIQVGCSSSEKILRDGFLKIYDETEKRKEGKKFITGINSEPYRIGPLASALLEESSQSAWQHKIEKGASPTQILLGSLSPLKDSHIPEGIKKECRNFNKWINEIKSEEEKIRKQIREMLNSQDYIALSFHLGENGIITLFGSPVPFNGLIEGYKTGNYPVTSSRLSKISFKGYHVLTPKQEENPCGKRQRVVLVPKKEIHFDDGQAFSINYQGREKLNKETSLFVEIDGKIQKKIYKDFMPFSLKGRGIIDKKIKQPGADLWCVH